MMSIGPVIQDAYHYLLSAGGRKSENKYGDEGQFATDRLGRSLACRLEFLQTGTDLLQQVKDYVAETLGRQIQMPPDTYFCAEEAETIEDVERCASRGLKMLVALARRLKIDPNTGEPIEEMDRRRHRYGV